MMRCCDEQTFERDPEPSVADIGKGRGVEFTVGRCGKCGAVLMHCWVGGVAGGVVTVSRELVDGFLEAEPTSRGALLADWYENLD